MPNDTPERYMKDRVRDACIIAISIFGILLLIMLGISFWMH